MRNFQLAMFRTGLACLDIPQDHAFVQMVETARKDGSCLIALNDGEEQRYVRTRKEPAIPDADNGYGTDFFRRDSVYLQGYLKGYDPRLGFDSGILYLSNEITRKDYPTVVPINPDGSFECKFILSYPVCQNLTLNNQWIPFYAEPGDTVTMYLDWEDIMARSRARDNKYPLIHTAYMGKTAALSYLADCPVAAAIRFTLPALCNFTKSSFADPQPYSHQSRRDLF